MPQTFIQFSEISIKTFIPFIFPIILYPQKYLKNKLEDNEFFKLFRYFFCQLLAGIFDLIIRYRERKQKKLISANEEKQEYSINNNDDDENCENSVNNISDNKINNTVEIINPLYYQFKKFQKNELIKKYSYILMMTIIYLMASFMNAYFETDNIKLGKKSVAILAQSLYFALLSRAILEQKIYRHQRIPLIIMSIDLLILLCHVFFQIKDQNLKYSLIYIILLYYFTSSFLYAFYDVLAKKYFSFFMSNLYTLIFFIGFFGSVILFIYDIIAIIINKFNTNYTYHGVIKGFKENFSLTSFIILIMELLLRFAWNMGIWFTIYYLTPCHFIISESFSIYLSTIVEIINGENNFSVAITILYIVIYLINMFLSLVFNEIIILNFWGLNLNTKKCILERELLDKEMSKKMRASSKCNDVIYLDSMPSNGGLGSSCRSEDSEESSNEPKNIELENS